MADHSPACCTISTTSVGRREDIALGAGELDVDLDEHIAVLEALQGSAAEIGLVGNSERTDRGGKLS